MDGIRLVEPSAAFMPADAAGDELALDIGRPHLDKAADVLRELGPGDRVSELRAGGATA